MKTLNTNPIFHKGYKQRGILFIHGFTGSPLEFKWMVDHFRTIGYGICVPLLAGHGTTPQEMRKTTWKDWYASVEQGYHQLREAGNRVIYAVGFSMGGLLALKMAQTYEFRAIAALSSPIIVHDQRLKYTKWLKYILPYERRTRVKPPHIESQILPYEKTPMVCYQSLYELIEQVKAELPLIQTPIIIAQGEKDETVRPASADYIYEQIGSNYKEIYKYPNSGHIITLDHEHYELFRDVAHFFERVTFQIEGKMKE